MAQTLRPLGDRVLVRRQEETAVKDGFIMPEGAKEKPVMGIVVAVGNGRRLDNGTILAVDLKEGERVTFGKFSGSEFKVNGEILLLMREEEVIGVLEGEADPEPVEADGLPPLRKKAKRK